LFLLRFNLFFDLFELWPELGLAVIIDLGERLDFSLLDDGLRFGCVLLCEVFVNISLKRGLSLINLFLRDPSFFGCHP
jgi:hypothetical protein